jgi:TIR domain/Pentapeptide repeats (8 copies)
MNSRRPGSSDVGRSITCIGMANDEHFQILKRGVVAWNNWRAENPDVVPDLHAADFSCLSIVGRALMQDLQPDWKMSAAEKRVYVMYPYDFKGVDFEFSNFQQTYLRCANLEGSSFDNADLTGACFDTVLLDGANFSGAIMRSARFLYTDLSKVVGLKDIAYWGGADIDIDTLINSAGNVPKGFFSFCGVPQSFVDLACSLKREFYSCFISYSNADIAFATQLQETLNERGVRCWFAPKDLRIGDRFRQQFEESIHRQDRMLLILSKNSISSPWVEDEVEAAIERERKEGQKVLLPIRIDNAVMKTNRAWAASLKRKYHIGDFSKAKDHSAFTTALNGLLDDLRVK